MAHKDLREEVASIVEDHKPLIVRNLFYLMVGNKLIPKTEKEYQSLDCFCAVLGFTSGRRARR